MSNNSLKQILRTGVMPTAVFFVIGILILTISRIGLLIWHPESTEGHLAEILGFGLRYDISICCTMFSPVLLLVLVCNILKATPKPLQVLQRVLLCTIVCTLLMLELTTPPFIMEYGVRPNHIFVDYLIYPKEVVSTLANGHIFESVVCLTATAFAFCLFYYLSGLLYRNYQNTSRSVNSIVIALVIIFIPMAIRGTLTHKPLNPSNASFCSNPLANTIPVNSAFSVFYSLRHMSANDVSKSQIYAFDELPNTIMNINYMSKRTIPSEFDLKCAINQVITPSVTGNRRNVVIILEESFGARYVKSLGGEDLSPNWDRLKKDAWWFNHMYATGHRSVRGIEAVTASFPPGPLTSQVTLDHSKPIATVSQIFKTLGYETSFIYGGESHFDNMRSYFLNNGVNKVIEQKDYKNPSFIASWGVSDEDLFEKANEEFVSLSKEGKPFCSVVFSSSFHDPFDIPNGKVNIDGIKTDDPYRLKAAKYADYALGRFFDMAQKEDYYKNTIFLVIADHDSRTRGIGAFPLKNFTIPAMIISPDVAPRVDNRIVSQIDMLPTILSLAGVSGQFPLSGQDLTKDNTFDRAPLAYNDTFGYVNGDNFTILAPPNFALDMNIGPDNSLIFEMKPPRDMSKEVSYLNLGIAIYKNKYSDADCIKNMKQQ